MGRKQRAPASLRKAGESYISISARLRLCSGSLRFAFGEFSAPRKLGRGFARVTLTPRARVSQLGSIISQPVPLFFLARVCSRCRLSAEFVDARRSWTNFVENSDKSCSTIQMARKCPNFAIFAETFEKFLLTEFLWKAKCHWTFERCFAYNSKT